MATVIRTGGQTIRISSARRAVEAVDPISAAMEAGEAFARSEIACEAFGALVNRAAQMSMEGKASMWKRVKAAGSRTWEAIKAFFRKMIAYVTSFISGNVIMIKAKRLKKRIEDDEDLWNTNADQNWTKKHFKSLYDTYAKRGEAFKNLEGDFKKACGDTTATTSSGIDYGYGSHSAYAKEKDLKKQGKSFAKTGDASKYINNGWDDNMTSKSPTCKEYFDKDKAAAAKDDVLKLLTQYSTGAVKSMVFLKATVVPTLNKMYKLAEKYAKEAADNSRVAGFKAAQRATKVTVQSIIKQTSYELAMIAGVIAEPAD